ncbi:hypothetical protein [Caldilinea sp.]|uniref:hypothetical protein n=1 Tax=Caldilinea sp. TaxID=2293560 RepID=UPI002C98FAA6|nr:hypothetical protein [Anaerolineales bacterium]HQY92313.1 hypothetical protein [Caldilinea sp.]
MRKTFQPFNLNTMSGVFPGTRTMVFQRVRLARLDAPVLARPGEGRWARILWYADPRACVVELEERDELPAGASDEPHAQAMPLERIVVPDPADLLPALTEALARAGWRLVTCGVCAHWQPAPSRTSDDLRLGHCRWQGDVMHTAPSTLTAQSVLAMACAHWRLAVQEPLAPAADALHADALHADEAAARQTPAPMRKRAEQETNERWTLLGQLRRWLRATPAPAAAPSPLWEDRIVERSGVGAGTTPCFACQGRIANLGALAVATPEGDKQTFSIWRCRTCYTCYLNDWIDRWERTDSLETEERYYRLSPAEALEVLAVIDNIIDAEHPARRHERAAQRDWMLAFLAGQTLLSHQIRQGR